MSERSSVPPGRGSSSGSPGNGEDQLEAGLQRLVECGQQALDELAQRVQHNVGLARQRKYGVDAWLDDVVWFWSGMAKGTSSLADGLQQVMRPERS